ncbi:MAG: phospholipase D family protein [Lachnospiraceae bacterium]|nr:phospholipase D family protein [Lachnospiraceae bacterium]
MKKKITRALKILGAGFACFLVYILIAMLVPFAHQKTVSDVNKTFDRENYYSDTVSVDRAAIIEDNNTALSERIRLIQGAKEQIILSTFDMREGHSAEDVIGALIAAADRGVQVKVLVDGISGMLHMSGKPLFFAMSANPNIEVRAYNTPNLIKPWTFNGRMHDKYLIADNKVMILGGRNTYDYFLGDYIEDNKSYDRDVLVYNTKYDKETEKSSVIYQVQEYFETVWKSEYSTVWHNEQELYQDEDVSEKKAELKARYNGMKHANPEWFDKKYSYEEDTEETNQITLISGETGIYGKEPKVWYELRKLMEQSEKSVRIHTPYAVMGTDMREDLHRITQSVSEASIMINSVETGDNFVASSDYLYHKKGLLETGVILREFVGGMSYHGKSILIDNELAIIGSYNLDLRSTYMDTEVMLVIQSKEIAADLAAYMDTYERQAKQVVKNENDEVEYESDELIIPEIPLAKKVAMKIVGLILQPFRYVI